MLRRVPAPATWAVIVSVPLALLVASFVAEAAPDAGPADAAPQVSAQDAAHSTDTRADAGTLQQQQIQSLVRELARLRGQTARIVALEPTELAPHVATAQILAVALDDVAAIAKRLSTLKVEVSGLRRKIKDLSGQLAAVEPLLRPSIKRLEALRKRKQRYKRLKIPQRVLVQGEAAERQLKQLGLEREVLQARLTLLLAQRAYLAASQPIRSARLSDRRAAAKLAEASQHAAEHDQEQALAESARAEKARQAALEQQRRARTEAERLLAAERARLEGVRVKQALLKQKLAKQRVEQARLGKRLDTFRGKVSGRAEALQRGWPETAPQFDRLYDQVVLELSKLRPDAVVELKNVIRGLDDPPHPGKRLPRRLYELGRSSQAAVTTLEKSREGLATAAEKLEAQQDTLADERLTALRREISGLNDHRLQIFRRVSVGKRHELTGLTREMVDQLTREVSQLVFDGLYWFFSRLRQIDEVPRLILDIFTVGSMLWALIKLVALLLLLRFLLRRWEAWLQAAVQRVSRSVSLGRNAVRLAKLTDALRHAGPALLVLIVAVLSYRILGGEEAAAEVRGVYILLFWIAAYRVQLRVVESGARFMGLEAALRAADEPEPEPEPEPEDDEKKDDAKKDDEKKDDEKKDDEKKDDEKKDDEKKQEPVELRPVAAPSGELAAAPVVPASVLLVRSVRAATRYVLVVVLLLDLTDLAVGHGTLYGLTSRFSWWATVPFVFYFLRLWKPHIVEAYLTHSEGQKREGTLARLVGSSQRRFYGVFVTGAAFLVVLGNRLARFARQYLTSLDATKKLLAFFFRRRVEKHAQEQGRVVVRRRDLPAVILEQFPANAISPAEIPRKEEFWEQILEVFNTWEAEKSEGSVALVGRAGMGKSTVLSRLEQELERPVLRCEVRTKITRPAKVVAWLADQFGFSPKPSSEKELIRLILEDTRPVIAVDNCHNLFLRQVGGFTAWETFVRIVNETCDNLFWVLTFNQAAWDYLNNISGRVHYFRRLIRMPAWSEDAIRKLIMKRMRRARHGVSFSDLVVTELQGVSMSAQLGRTSAGYFRMLWDSTGGNPKLAGHFWLDSLVPEEGRRLVRVNLFAPPNIEQLEALQDDIIFVLTAITEHQNLSVAEAAKTTNLSPDFCNFAIKYCVEAGYLRRDPQTGRYMLSVRWQHPIHRFLKRKHLLHN